MDRLMTIGLVLVSYVGLAQQGDQTCDRLGYYNCEKEVLNLPKEEINAFDEIEFSKHFMSVYSLEFGKLKPVSGATFIKNAAVVLDRILGIDTTQRQSGREVVTFLAVGKITGENYTTVIFAKDESMPTEHYTARLLYMATISKDDQLKSVVTISDQLASVGAAEFSSYTVKKNMDFSRFVHFQGVNDVIRPDGKTVNPDSKGVIKFRLNPTGFVEVVKCPQI